MPVDESAFREIKAKLNHAGVTLVAVSKTKPVEDILQLYSMGQRDFGENYVQELLDKESHLPKDIRWHFIGHLQTNKVKQIISFVDLIHGVDSLKLLNEIDKQGKKINRVIPCLLQIHIAKEDTKFGLDEKECIDILKMNFTHANISGLMGMATFTDDTSMINQEFQQLHDLFLSLQQQYPRLTILSAGMSADYRLAINHGSNMVRIGSLLFGKRE